MEKRESKLIDALKKREGDWFAAEVNGGDVEHMHLCCVHVLLSKKPRVVVFKVVHSHATLYFVTTTHSNSNDRKSRIAADKAFPHCCIG